MKCLKVIFGVLSFFIASQAWAATIGIQQIDIENENTINAIFSENPNIEVGDVNAEIKILHDMNLRGAVIKEGTTDKVEIFLDADILSNTKYSILTISGAEGSIDFETPDDVVGFTGFSLEQGDTQGIESVEITDARTLLVSYAQDVVASSFDYKLLAEKKLTKIEKKSSETPSLTITINPPLISSQDYILMFVDLLDADGEIIEFDTGIYDFTSPVFGSDATESEAEAEIPEDNSDDSVIEQAVETPEDIVVLEPNNLNAPDSSEDNTDTQEENDNKQVGRNEVNPVSQKENPSSLETQDIKNMSGQNINIGNEPSLNAAPGETIIAGKGENGNVNEVAASASANPQAGTATGILIVLSLLINTFFYFTRRKT